MDTALPLGASVFPCRRQPVLAIGYVRIFPIGITVVTKPVCLMDSYHRRRSHEVNRSTGQGHAVNAPELLSYARRLLHAFAEAGQPSAAGPQLFLGPNGGLMWTDGPHVDRSEKYPGTVFPEKSAPAPVDAESPEVVCPQEPAGSPAYGPLEAPAPNEALGIS